MPKAEGRPMDENEARIRRLVDQRRKDNPAFIERLSKSLVRNKPILDGLRRSANSNSTDP